MRTRRPSSVSKRKRPIPYIAEFLEPRRLLTTFVGGQSFSFFDEFGNYDRIAFYGNITAEVIGATGGGASLINLPPAVIGPKPAVNPLNSLFAIYVSQSDFTGSITFAQVPSSNFNAVPITNLATTPYAGSINKITVLNDQSGLLDTINAPGGSGGALLGAVTNPAAAVNPAIPVLSLPVDQAFGVLPVPIDSPLSAGIIVAPGQNVGSILIGGTVMGNVNIGAAINTFYAGWLLTGNANGEAAVNTDTFPQNFTVAGDIQNLLVGTSIGCIDDALLTKPIYVSGFDMFANGTIGTVHAFSGILGSINSANNTGVPTNGADQLEIEHSDFLGGFVFPVDPLTGLPDPTFPGADLIGLNTFAGGPFENGNINTAEFISDNFNTTTGTDNGVVVDGILQDVAPVNDNDDYYAVPLLAGQTITVQVQPTAATIAADLAAGITTTPNAGVNAGVFDPDGREIASDYNLNSGGTTTGANLLSEKPFQFTTDRPGIYKFVVAPTGDSTFDGAVLNAGVLPYTLSISNVGHMAIGSIVAAGNICDNTEVLGGGLGGGGSGAAGFGTQSDDLGAIVSGGDFVSSSTNTIAVENGSLRAIVAGTIGTGAAGTDPEISVPNGNVGLVESTTGNMFFNDGLAPQPIGGDYQVVSSAGNFIGQLIANGNIGTVRAAGIVPNNAQGNSVFSVDANGLSGTGMIDLIDDTGDLGNNNFGGPSIKVGPDGVLKYLNVDGTVFGNPVFGQVQGGQTNTFPAGAAVPIVEPSGAIVTLTPVVTTAVPAPALTVTTYALDDGGTVVANVTTTGGLTVSGSGNVPGQTFGIGAIHVQGNGNPVVAGVSNLSQNFGGHTTVPILSPPTIPLTVAPLNVVFSGNVGISVLNLDGGNFDEIADNTPGGEIQGIGAASIGTLAGSDPIGTNLYHSTAAAVLPFTAGFSNTFPFNGQRGGITATGDIVNINLSSVGNIFCGGTIGTISGSITAPVFATGNINNVILGSQGILPSGSGNLSNAGIYANGVIGNVVGNNCDIRGNIASTTGIQSVHLQNGSIINANIATYVTLSDSENIRQGGTMSPNGGGTLANPVLTIGGIVTNGSGGIIGSWFQTGSLGVVSSRNGFGILGTLVDTTAIGTVGSIYADGYGVRGILEFGGFNVGSVTANGNGSLDSTAIFSNQVRFSESDQFDPFFGFPPNAATDIDVFLGATVTTPVIPGVTDTGVIEGSEFFGGHNLGSVRAWSIRSTPVPVGSELVITPTVSTFNFANSIGSIITTGPVNGMTIVTGKLGTLLTGGDLSNTSLTISGRINNLTVRANLTDNSSIIAHGRNGNIGNLTVLGNVAGLIQADGGKIGNVKIHGSLSGRIQTKVINDLVLYQNLGAGALEITGSANTIQLMQDLGPLGNTLTVDGKVNTLKVGSNLTGNIIVKGALGKLQVGGSIVNGAKVTVGTILGLLQVGADFQAGAVVQADKVKKVKVRGANAGTISII